MIPTGHYPTGVIQSSERKNRIYDVAERHDLYILEHDPYYDLQLGTTFTTSENTNTNFHTADRYLVQLSPSYLTIDTSGIVLTASPLEEILGAPRIHRRLVHLSDQNSRRGDSLIAACMFLWIRFNPIDRPNVTAANHDFGAAVDKDLEVAVERLA
ncbi:hypothetical protein DPSP01_012157 [Paraphaeosphaeria sporulosa]